MLEVIKQSTVVRKTCDGCGKAQEWEMIGPSPEAVAEMEQWITHIREIMVGGHFQKIAAQSCSKECATPACEKIPVPPMQTAADEEIDGINLADLQVTKFPTN